MQRCEHFSPVIWKSSMKVSDTVCCSYLYEFCQHCIYQVIDVASNKDEMFESAFKSL